jgi:hypothetical protein
MGKTTILENEAMKLYYHDDAKIVHHEMVRYPGARLLESVLTRGLDLLRERGAQKWLSDDREGGALPKSHHEWGEQVWGPRAAAAGWRYWALVPPADVIGKMNMARLIKTYAAMGVTVELFQSPEQGLEWLRKL